MNRELGLAAYGRAHLHEVEAFKFNTVKFLPAAP